MRKVFLLLIAVFVLGCTAQQEVDGTDMTQAASQECEDVSVVFGASPLDLENLEYIVPLGLMVGSHVTPIDHQYWTPPDSEGFHTAADSDVLYEVKSPADGILTEISKIEGSGYRFVIEHSCTLYTIYIVVYNMSERILFEAEFREDGWSYSRINVSEGEVVGYIKNHPFDFSVHDETFNLTGFVVPEHYDAEPWKIHTVDPFDYFSEPLASQLKAKSLRRTEPLAGKIDFDIDGRLVGNWFRDDCGDYACSLSTGSPYSSGHLSIVYDHIDPNHIVISFGDFFGEQRVFGVKTNSPDPTEISIEDGLIKYELVEFDSVVSDGYSWDRKSFHENITARNNEDAVRAVVLFQLVGNRTLKMELLDSTSEATGFSQNALTYMR